MAAAKKKKAAKVRDLKPSKDARGGAGRSDNTSRNNALGGRDNNASGTFGVGSGKQN